MHSPRRAWVSIGKPDRKTGYAHQTLVFIGLNACRASGVRSENGVGPGGLELWVLGMTLCGLEPRIQAGWPAHWSTRRRSRSTAGTHSVILPHPSSASADGTRRSTRDRSPRPRLHRSDRLRVCQSTGRCIWD